MLANSKPGLQDKYSVSSLHSDTALLYKLDYHKKKKESVTAMTANRKNRYLRLLRYFQRQEKKV